MNHTHSCRYHAERDLHQTGRHLTLAPGPDFAERIQAAAAAAYAREPSCCDRHIPPEPLPFDRCAYPAHWNRWAQAPPPEKAQAWPAREIWLETDDPHRESVRSAVEAQMPCEAISQYLSARTALYVAKHPEVSPDLLADEARIDLLGWQRSTRRVADLMQGLAWSSGDSAPAREPDGTWRFPVTFRVGECPVGRLGDAGFQALHQRCSFENFTADTAELQANLAKAREFAAAAADGGGFLLLLGKCGTGKTHLAAAIVRAAGRGCYFRHLDLINRLRASYDRRRGESGPEEIAETCRNASLLVIDELGVAPGGNDGDVLLHDILDDRVGAFRPTVLCANIPAGELEGHFGDRLADRFRHALFAVLNFTGPSRRSAGNAAYLEAARRHRQATKKVESQVRPGIISVTGRK